MIDIHLFVERQLLREKLGEVLAEKLMNVAEAMNRHEYVPKMPNQSELDLVFDTTIADVQPYLYRVSKQKTSSQYNWITDLLQVRTGSCI